jgi:hypothetical protein
MYLSEVIEIIGVKHLSVNSMAACNLGKVQQSKDLPHRKSRCEE